jgi:hypothetical protein
VFNVSILMILLLNAYKLAVFDGKSIDYVTNYVALALEQTISTDRPPLVGEVIAKLLRIEGVSWSALRISTIVISIF